MFRYVAVCLLLFPVLIGIPAGAAESSYTLVGTVESKDFTGAVIIAPDGIQSFHRLRETLPDGAQLVQVHSDRITVKGSDGARYEIFITTAGKLQSASASGVPAMTTPQTKYPADQSKNIRSTHRRSRQSSADEE